MSLLRLVLCSALVGAAACSSAPEVLGSETTDSVSREETGDSVLFFDDELARYIDAVSGAPESEMPATFDELVVQPATTACVGDGEFASFATQWIDSPIIDTGAARDAIDVLDADGLELLVENELATLQQALPGPPVTVCVFIAGDENAQFIGDRTEGVSGVTAGAGRVLLDLNPAKASDAAIRYTLAHEYHHSWWTSFQARRPRFDLLGYLLFEGRADAFAQLQHPEHVAPWTEAITLKQQLELWATIERSLTNTGGVMLENVMFGGGRFPEWAGYTIGNQIVVDYLAAAGDVPVSEWSLLSPEEILEQSGFAQR